MRLTRQRAARSTATLFAEEDERGIWFDDPDLLNKLAMDSLHAAARELETRWKWAEARIDMDWSATASFGRVRPQPTEPTDGEKAEIKRLRTRNDELANMEDDGWTEELVEEADANEMDPSRKKWRRPTPFALPSASNLTGLVKSSVECRRTGL